MFPYSMIFAKLGLGLLALILQINLLGKRNLAPTSALDQIQNYVLGGIIGGVIYNDTISIFQFLMIMVVWTILVMTLKYLKSVSRHIRILVDGKPVILIEQGELQTETCLRSGIQAFELQMKLRAMGVQRIQDVKRAVLEQKRAVDGRPNGGRQYPLSHHCRRSDQHPCPAADRKRLGLAHA